jgi:two-component system, sensor histidine kinase YesM
MDQFTTIKSLWKKIPKIFREKPLSFQRKSIQSKLLSTYIIINIVPLIMVGMISYTVAADAISEEVKKNNNQLVEEVSRNINMYLLDLNQLSNTYVSKVLYKSVNSMEALNKQIDLNDIEVLENLMQMNEYLYTTFNSSDTFLSIRLFTDEGEFLSSAFNMQSYQLYSYNSPEEIKWQQRMYNNRTESLIFDVHPLERNGEFSFVASRAAINPYTNKRYGYICYDKEFSSFSNIFKQFERREGSEVQVIKEDGTFLYNSNQALIGQKVDPKLYQLIQGANSGTLVQKINHKKMIITYNKLTYGNLMVVGSVPVSVLVQHIHPLQNIILIISVISLILVVILSLILSFYIARPIKKLSSLMTQVESGNFNVIIDNINEKDEIGHLSMSFNSMVGTIRQLIKTRYEMELRNKDAELKALLMQINPHFLYNTLEVVSGIADCEGVQKISEITQSLSKMLRYNIDLKNEKVRIADELQNCKNFFLILKSRFEDNLIIETDIDTRISNYVIVKLVLQPIIENSIKHGIEKRIGKGHIKLTAKKLKNSVLIQVMDDGVGFSPEKLQEFEQFTEKVSASFYDSTTTKNLGLKNVYARLKIFFGDKLEFQIDSISGQGTTISISIPAIEYND